MATTKPPIPPLNLKDRIAALQQRNAGPSHAEPKHSAAGSNATRPPGSLRDKIASFEKQGAVPVPRGSFGLGALPMDDGSSRRRGEMIGNRVPGLSRPVAPIPTYPSRATSPSSPGRSRAASATFQSSASSRSVSPTTTTADGEAEGFGTLEAALEELASPRSPRQSGALQARRRSVSDMVAKFQVPALAVESLPEGQEDVEPSEPPVVVSQEPGDASLKSHTSSPVTPAAPATGEAMSDHDTPLPLGSGEAAPSSSREPIAPSSRPQPQAIHDGTEGEPSSSATLQPAVDKPPPSAAVEVDEHPVGNPADVPEAEPSDPPAASDVSSAAEAHPASSVQDQIVTVATSSLAVAASDEPSVSAPALRRNDVEEGANKEVTTDEAVLPTASSTASSSKLPTPQDSVAFPSAETVPSMVVTPVQTNAVDVEEFANQSLALDSQDAVIVTGPTRVVTPVMTRAVLVPVSPISPSQVDESPDDPARKFVEPSLTPKTTTGSFRAVVHHKVTEGANGNAASQAQRVSDLRVALDSPQSPGFTDLADLLADAALLERQLSGLGSPRKLPAGHATPSTPPSASALRNVSAPRVEVTIPEQPSLADDISTSGDGHGSSEYNSAQEFPSMSGPRPPSPITPPKDRRRSRMVSDTEPQTPGPITPAKERPRSRLLSDTPPPVPPKSPRPRYFSTILSRRPSAKDGLMPMPGAYPRNSVCSEVSEDDSVLATPPSPRFDPVGSDTSSVMSSSRSWKMPSKGLSRATSFADRLWNKRSNRNTVVIASPDDDAHLSAKTAVRPRRSEPMPTLPQLNLAADSRTVRQPSAGADERPMSWVSVSSSLASGGLDSALFDAFPSVPDTVPPVPAFSEDLDLSPQSSSSGYRDSLSNRGDHFPARSSSLHPKQRSSFL